MYEIGYAHGRGLKPMIYTRNAARLKRPPVHFRTLNVQLATQAGFITQFIDDYLTSVKAIPSPSASFLCRHRLFLKQ